MPRLRAFSDRFELSYQHGVVSSSGYDVPGPANGEDVRQRRPGCFTTRPNEMILALSLHGSPTGVTSDDVCFANQEMHPSSHVIEDGQPGGRIIKCRSGVATQQTQTARRPEDPEDPDAPHQAHKLMLKVC